MHKGLSLFSLRREEGGQRRYASYHVMECFDTNIHGRSNRRRWKRCMRRNHQSRGRCHLSKSPRSADGLQERCVWVSYATSHLTCERFCRHKPRANLTHLPRALVRSEHGGESLLHPKLLLAMNNRWR
ncbi:hypothetical protein BD309DRAFT_622680 [Dichomitus squalens]|nr:hypothetical protein BD309DRAFT_622680 [Dichomitus squalens]